MLNITRRGNLFTLTADPPEQVRFKHPNGQFYPSRAGRLVGTGFDLWTVEVAPGLSVRFQQQQGADWVDASEGG